MKDCDHSGGSYEAACPTGKHRLTCCKSCHWCSQMCSCFLGGENGGSQPGAVRDARRPAHVDQGPLGAVGGEGVHPAALRSVPGDDAADTRLEGLATGERHRQPDGETDQAQQRGGGFDR